MTKALTDQLAIDFITLDTSESSKLGSSVVEQSRRILDDIGASVLPKALRRQTRVGAVRDLRKVVFHPESSDIESSSFGLKFRFRGGTYLVRGRYHAVAMSYLRDDQVQRTVDFLSIDSILTYCNGEYVVSRVLKQNEIELTDATREIIKNPYTNPFLTTVHERTTMA